MPFGSFRQLFSNFTTVRGEEIFAAFSSTPPPFATMSLSKARPAAQRGDASQRDLCMAAYNFPANSKKVLCCLPWQMEAGSGRCYHFGGVAPGEDSEGEEGCPVEGWPVCANPGPKDVRALALMDVVLVKAQVRNQLAIGALKGRVPRPGAGGSSSAAAAGSEGVPAGAEGARAIRTSLSCSVSPACPLTQAINSHRPW